MEKSSNTENAHLENTKKVYKWACKANNVKVGETDTPIKGYLLHDLKIRYKFREDDIYLNDDETYYHVRRGNCIASFSDEDGQICYKIARKGIRKFFDYLHENAIKKDSKKIKKRVLKPVKDAFKSDKKVYVYISEKANGENVQISYDSQFKAWIIGSKNVSLLARDENDLIFYKNIDQGSKFNYCLEFANLWFQILQKEIISHDRLEEFIEAIKDHTLVGENIGLEHQHIKLYKANTIVFYSIVKNDSEEICLLISESQKLLQEKFNLNFVEIEKSNLLESYEDFYNYMENKYEEILKKNVEEGGEGSVAYISMVDEDGKEEIISMCKLKTFEYRILRKLREKIKTKTFPTDEVKTIISKIEKECEQLLGEEGDSIDLGEYMKFVEFVIRYVRKYISNRNGIIEKYASFIEKMKNLYNTKTIQVDELISGNNEKISDSNDIQEVENDLINLKINNKDEDGQSFNNEIIQSDQNDSNGDKIKISLNFQSKTNKNKKKTKKSGNKKNKTISPIKYMEELSDETNKYNLDNLKNSSEKEDPINEKSKKQKKNRKDKMQNKSQSINSKDVIDINNTQNQIISEDVKNTPKKNKVFFIACIGLVCSGKSTVYQLLQKYISNLNSSQSESFNIMYVSSDTITSRIVNDYIGKHPNIEFNDAFDKVKNQSKKTFTNEIKNTLYNQYQKEKINLFFLDKNFNDDTVESLNKDLNNICGSNFNFQIIIFIPDTVCPIDEDGMSFPFSWSYLIQAYFRLKNRKDHETLSYSINKYAHYILISFLFLFKGTKFSINNDKISIHKIPFVDEKEIEMSIEMVKLFKKIFKSNKSKIFNIKAMYESDDLIEEFFNKLDEKYEPAFFKDTRQRIYKELGDVIEKLIKENE